MKMGEIVTADDKLELAQLIFNNTFKQLTAVPHVPTKPNQYALPKKAAIPAPVQKPKAKAPKRAPMAAPPKPLPKPKPIALSATQIKNKQLKNQQAYAQAVKSTLDKDNAVKVPKSLQPLPSNIISPVNHNRSERDKQEVIKQARGETLWRPLD